jgi:hypothetical protein
VESCPGRQQQKANGEWLMCSAADGSCQGCRQVRIGLSSLALPPAARRSVWLRCPCSHQCITHAPNLSASGRAHVVFFYSHRVAPSGNVPQWRTAICAIFETLSEWHFLWSAMEAIKLLSKLNARPLETLRHVLLPPFYTWAYFIFRANNLINKICIIWHPVETSFNNESNDILPVTYNLCFVV